MGRINYIKKDLFTTKKDVIAHGVNCMGAFGSGIAGQISKIYPHVKTAYLDKYQEKGWRLGDVQIVKLSTKIFANMATQKTFGKTGIHVDYDACSNCFHKIVKYCTQNDFDFAMPMIGSGLGGGDWKEIENRLIEVLEKYNTRVDVHYI